MRVNNNSKNNNNNTDDSNKKKKSSIKCPYCNSTRINKNGNKYNKQRYICTHCKKSFSFNDKRVKRSDKERELALLLYIHNSSIRSIQSVINKFFDTKISFNLIDNWIKTYTKQLKRDIDIEEIDENINDEEKEEELKEGSDINSSNKDEDNINCYDNINSNISSNSNNNNNINNNNITKKNKPKPKTIDILELDELYSYFYDLKKNEKRESKYGLLLIGTEIKLLHLK